MKSAFTVSAIRSFPSYVLRAATKPLQWNSRAMPVTKVPNSALYTHVPEDALVTAINQLPEFVK